MRSISMVVGMLAITCSLAGCGDGDSTASTPPEEAKQALDITKKANRGPMFKGNAPGSTGVKK